MPLAQEALVAILKEIPELRTALLQFAEEQVLPSLGRGQMARNKALEAVAKRQGYPSLMEFKADLAPALAEFTGLEASHPVIRRLAGTKGHQAVDRLPGFSKGGTKRFKAAQAAEANVGKEAALGTKERAAAQAPFVSPLQSGMIRDAQEAADASLRPTAMVRGKERVYDVPRETSKAVDRTIGAEPAIEGGNLATPRMGTVGAEDRAQQAVLADDDAVLEELLGRTPRTISPQDAPIPPMAESGNFSGTTGFTGNRVYGGGRRIDPQVEGEVAGFRNVDDILAGGTGREAYQPSRQPGAFRNARDVTPRMADGEGAWTGGFQENLLGPRTPVREQLPDDLMALDDAAGNLALRDADIPGQESIFPGVTDRLPARPGPDWNAPSAMVDEMLPGPAGWPAPIRGTSMNPDVVQPLPPRGFAARQDELDALLARLMAEAQ